MGEIFDLLFLTAESAERMPILLLFCVLLISGPYCPLDISYNTADKWYEKQKACKQYDYPG